LPSDINIVDVRLLVNNRLTEGAVSISDGKIIKIGKEPTLPSSAEIIQGKKLLALPGLVDVHVHLRDLEQSYKEDFLTGTSAGAAGGFTTLIDMPNTTPVTDTAERLREKMEIARQKIVVNVGFNVVPSNLEEVTKARELAMGYKINLVKQWSSLPTDDSSLTSLIGRAEEAGKMLIFHAEDGAMVSELEEKFNGNTSFKSYYKAHPPEAEDTAVKRVLKCGYGKATHIHFCHISSINSLKLIKAAKNQGRKTTCEVTPHHLLLDESLSKLGGIGIMDPPLRKKEVARSLFSALKRQAIDIVGTDHAPHSIEEKNQPTWRKIPPGIPGLETALPALLTEVARGNISLGRVVEAMTESPARIFQLNRGTMKEGFPADIILVDPKRRFRIDSSLFFSKAKYSPFDGKKVVGKVIKTFVGGKLIFDENEIVEKPGVGRILFPHGS
jgi:dihydroorotase